MASDELRRRAGAPGHQTGPEETKPNPKGRRREKAVNVEDQAAILSPQQLRVTVTRGEEDLSVIVPTEFTLGQIIDRRIMDDVELFARLVMLEARNVAPEEISPAELFKPEYAPYLEIALSASNVRDKLRRLVVKIARIEGADEGVDRVTIADAESMSARDMIFLGVWFFRRWLDEIAKAAAKNRARTT